MDVKGPKNGQPATSFFGGWLVCGDLEDPLCSAAVLIVLKARLKEEVDLVDGEHRDRHEVGSKGFVSSVLFLLHTSLQVSKTDAAASSQNPAC